MQAVAFTVMLFAGLPAGAATQPVRAGVEGGWSTALLLLATLLTLVLLVVVLLRLWRRLNAALVEEGRLQLVLDAVPNAIVKIDQQGLIALVNAQTEAYFGYRREEMLGKPVEMLMPERFRHGHQAFRDHFLASPQKRSMGSGRELYGLRKDGSEFPLEIGLNPIQTDQGVKILSSVVDITERKRLEDRFRLVVEATPNAVIVANQQGVIELINSETEKLFGYQREELLGQSVDLLVPHRFRGHHPQFRESYTRDPQARPMGSGRDLYGLRKDGSEFPVEIGLASISTDKGLLVLSTVIDISARKQAERQLMQQAEQLATASRYKSEFLANMSHELRTPLNSILILSEQLRDNASGNLSPKQLEHADVIFRSGCDLLSLINDILDLSKIEAGRMPVNSEPIALATLAGDIRRSFALQAEKKGLQFDVAIAEDVPATMVGDFQRLLQILKNLVSNALKFTRQGSVRVDFSVRQADALLAVTVADTGLGIPADKHELIFQAFHQVDGSTSRQYGGTGLGLTISRQLATLLGGWIELHSEEGVGSVFTLLLPLQSTASESESVAAQPGLLGDDAMPAGREADPEPVGNGANILLVDDDVRNIYALTSLLEAQGFEVRSARNGADAVRLLQQGIPADLVLMDMMMPVLDGYEATRQLREQLQFDRPIVAVTACAMKGDREKCLEAGASDYLAKPVNSAELIATVRKWLNAAPVA